MWGATTAFYTPSFDGKDDNGNLLSSGPHPVLFSRPGGVEAKKMLAVRP